MTTVSLYCRTDNGKGIRGLPDARWGSVEIEFTPAVIGSEIEFRVFYKEPTSNDDAERKMISSRPMNEREVRKLAEALKGLLA